MCLQMYKHKHKRTKHCNCFITSISCTVKYISKAHIYTPLALPNKLDQICAY